MFKSSWASYPHEFVVCAAKARNVAEEHWIHTIFDQVNVTRRTAKKNIGPAYEPTFLTGVNTQESSNCQLISCSGCPISSHTRISGGGGECPKRIVFSICGLRFVNVSSLAETSRWCSLRLFLFIHVSPVSSDHLRTVEGRREGAGVRTEDEGCCSSWSL